MLFSIGRGSSVLMGAGVTKKLVIQNRDVQAWVEGGQCASAGRARLKACLMAINFFFKKSIAKQLDLS